MKKVIIKIVYDEEKLKAIRLSLKQKNKNFDGEINKFLDTLYTKNVPQVLRKYIESNFDDEEKINESSNKWKNH